MPLDKPDGAPHNTSRGDPANSPPPAASRSAPDTRQQDLVAAYLALIDKFGAGHRAVKDFVSQHENNPELKEWTSVVDDLHAKGGSAHRQRSLRRLLWAISAAVVPLFIVVGVYALLGAGQVQGEMAKVREERDRAVSESHRLALSLEEKDKELRLYANAKDEIAKMQEQVTQANMARLNAERAADEQRAQVSALAKERDASVEDLANVREQKLALEKKLEEQRAQASALAKERDASVKELAGVRGQLATVQRDLDAKGAEALALTKERDASVKELASVRTDMSSMKEDYESRLRKNLDRISLVIAGCSRLSTLDLPRGSKLPQSIKLVLRSEGDDYARAILANYFRDQEHYWKGLELAANDKKDPWSPLAAAELEGADGEPRALIDWLGDLERRLLIRDDSLDEPASISLLLVQQEVSEQALVRVYSLSKDKAALLEKLTDATETEKAPQRLAMVAALGALGPEAKTSVPTLIPLLKDQSALMRWQVARTLGEIGPGAKQAIDALRAAAESKDEDSSIRAQAANALLRIEIPGQ